MNERIKDIAKDHFCRTEYDNGNVHECYEFSEQELEKFAELIVRECAELTLDYKNEQHYNGWLDYRDEIRKHFGVEE